ncbi:hypothetical protein CGZ94_15540 [Enemella evansiae]|uniref:YCII-related domain-containing protein n=2 Tax=Enemella evansiae TaxID=2016499 RepID=A0A255G7B0_9ACTN|nr:hypothetical protein CGZ95_10980 [Enemella evansiae]OYO09155.1 hypothetical protein CGZ98_15455 [Enemella evansiae]OYO11808.1 hypothetical protein CGZ94_15540 [Enemella evansiae]
MGTEARGGTGHQGGAVQGERGTVRDAHAGQPSGPILGAMPTYAVHYLYSDDTDKRMQVRPDHRDYLAKQDGLLAGGAYPPSEEPPAGLLIFRGESREAVAAILAEDPYQTNGLVKEVRIVEWRPVLGSAIDHLN